MGKRKQMDIYQCGHCDWITTDNGYLECPKCGGPVNRAPDMPTRDINAPHTPGPWETSRDAVPAGHVQITVYAKATGERVATVFAREANAHLIKAAPDMLETLRTLEASATLIEQRWESGDLAGAVRQLMEDRDTARDIIAQAEGV